MRRTGPWQRALLVTSALSAAFFAAAWVWQAGHPQWAFLIAFLAVWVTLSLVWSEVQFTEDSGVLLAEIVDRNIDGLHDRLGEVERILEELREQRATLSGHASRPPA